MLEPEKIRNKRFATVKNGCNPSEVSAFLGEIADELEGLLAEKSENEEKLKMLLEKVNQYRDDEDAIKQAMVYAQKESNKLLRDAKAKARDMIESAKTEEVRIREQSSEECKRIVEEHKTKCAEIIKQQTEDTQAEIANIQDTYEEEKEKLDKLRAEVTYFKSDLIDLYQKQLALLLEMPQMSDEELGEYEDNASAEYYEDDAEYDDEYYNDEEYYEDEPTEEELAQAAEEERINRALDTHSFEPIIPKVDPSTLRFGNNTIH